MASVLKDFVYLPWSEAQKAERQGTSQAAGSQAVVVAHAAEDVQVIVSCTMELNLRTECV
jgi:hypothetical protein